jgi:integrase
MSQTPPSRQSLADVISAVSQANLTVLQRRDQVSAVRTVARLLGAPPEAIDANVPLLRNRLQDLSSGAAGVTAGRWANIRSLFGRALSHVGSVQPSRSLLPVSAAWEAMLADLDRNRATRLRPLLRHLSSLGIEPSTVTLVDLEGYRDTLLNNRLRRKPENAWNNLLWAWNACAREVQGWPRIQIERPSQKETYILPWSSFPPKLKADVDTFLDWRGGFDISEDGPARPARPATLKQREYQLRIAASALVHKGQQAADLRSLRDRVTLDNVRTVLNFLLDRHGRKPAASIGYIAGFLKYVAETYLELDDVSVLQLKKLTSKLQKDKTKGLTPKNRERLRPFDDPKTVESFLALASRIRTELERDKRAAKPKALLAQAAAAIAILQAAPIRIGNLAGIRLEKHLIERSDRVYLIFAEEEVKNRQPIELELPEQVLEILAWYVRDHRPQLLASSTDALFPGRAGQPKSSQLLGAQIGKAVHQYVGIRMHAHLFRHASAKIFLDQRPGQYEVVRQVLGHRSMQTTTAIYAGAETRSASAHFASVINERRAEQDRPQRKRRRGASWIPKTVRA